MNGRPALPRHPDPVQALQDCLARVEAGATSVASLADCETDLAVDLAPLLLAADALKQRRAVPSEAFLRRAGLALARADLQRPDHAWWPRLSARAGILRLAAVVVALVVALGSLTVAQASRNPQGWAGRAVAQAWRAARSLPQLWGSSTVGLPPEPAPATLPPRPAEPVRATSSASLQGRVPAGRDTGPSIAPVAATPGVQLGQKPRSSGAGALPQPTAPATEMRPEALAPATVTALPSPAASPDGSSAGGAGQATPTVALAGAAAGATLLPRGAPTPGASPAPGKAVGSSISGRVSLQGGRPLAKLPVTVFRHDAKGNARWWEPVATTRTDADGRYQLRDLPPGSYKVMAGYLFLLAPRRWYPAAARSTEGQAVVLSGGQTRDDVDLSFGEEMAAPLLVWRLWGQ